MSPAAREPRQPLLAHWFPVPATVIVGAQWGDEGKGKIVDLLAQHSDLVCRYQGGPNAGHTIIFGGETHKIRQIPTGILSGKTAVLGNVGQDPRGTLILTVHPELISASP